MFYYLVAFVFDCRPVGPVAECASLTDALDFIVEGQRNCPDSACGWGIWSYGSYPAAMKAREEWIHEGQFPQGGIRG